MKSGAAKFNFGWGKTFQYGFLVSAIILLTVSFLSYLLLPTIWIVPIVFFLVSLNLFAGDAALRYVNRATSELVLPFVDLLSSEHDLILDAGCGHGRTPIAVSKIMKNGHIVALDRFDAPYIKDERAALENNLRIAQIEDRVKIVTGDVTKLEFENNTFDAAVSSFMMDHLGEQKQIALQEINRVLKSNGKFLLIVSVQNYLTFAIASFFSLMFMAKKSVWRELFQQTGFTLLQEGDINGAAYFLLQKTSKTKLEEGS